MPINTLKNLVLKAVLLVIVLSLAAPLGANSAAFDPMTASLDTVQMNKYLEALAVRLGEEAWQRIDSRSKLEAERERLHREFMFMIGLDPLPERTDLRAEVVRTVELDDYTIEVIHFQSLPRFYVTANLYRPRSVRGPFPAVIWGPGHGSGTYGTKTSRQPHAALWARNGYICMVVDPIQAAEVYGIHHGLAGYELNEWYSRGYTPMAIEVWNTIRAVDYLAGRPDVDSSKLTITGVSGGGHLSWMAGAADPRLSVVQPAAGTADVATHIRRNLYRMHCDCAYFINTYRHDWTTLAALISPRPLLIHTSTGDSYYPPEVYLSVLEKARKVYSWYGEPNRVDMCEVQGPHGYNKIQRERGLQFSNIWLLGENRVAAEQPIEEVDAEKLGALGGINARHPENINERVYEVLLPAVRPERPADRHAWEARRDTLMEKLRGVVLRNMPVGLTPVKIQAGEGEAYLLETEPGIRIGMISHVPRSESGIKSAVIYIASPGETWRKTIWGFMKPFPLKEKPTSKHMVYPRGIGTQIWNDETTEKYRRDALILGRSLDDMRLCDILCAIEAVASDSAFKDCEELTLIGKGTAGVLGAYAALLDQRVARVILHSPTTTHRDGPHFLNILRFTDLPETLAMLAPRCELVFLTHEIEEFGLTREVYKLYGAGDKFRRCVSVTQALNLRR